MHPSLCIARKDLRQRVRDRSAFMLSIVVPFALAAILGLLFGPASTPSPFAYAVVDLDRTPVTRAFVADVLGALEQRGVATITETGPDAARDGVRGGDLDAAFVLPEGFATALEGTDPTDVQVVGSADSATATDVARSVARSYVEGLNAARVAVAAVRSGRPDLTPAEMEGVAQDTVHAAAPVTLADVSATSHVLDTKTYLAAGMAVFFLLFTVQFGVSSLIDERGEGTLVRLLAAPLPRWTILAGKLLTSLVLGVVSMTVLVIGTTVLLGASWGDPFAVGLLIVAGVLAGMGITSVVASLAKTPEQAGGWQAVVAVSLGLLGGSFFPVQQSGEPIATLSLLTPHAWFMRGLGDLSGGGSAAQVIPAVVALLTIAMVTGAVALVRIGRVVSP